MDDESIENQGSAAAESTPTSDERTGDAVSGATPDDDGVPTPTGSVPPGPASAGEVADDIGEPPNTPLSERLY